MKSPVIASPPLRSILKKAPPVDRARSPAPALRAAAAAAEDACSSEPDSDKLRGAKYILFPVLLAVFSIWLYRSTLQAGFVWDDRAAIVGNKDVHGWSGSMWRHDFWGADLTLGDSHKSYRPVTVLTYRLNYSLHGLQSWGYHFGNLLVYACVVLAVFALALLLFDRWGVAAVSSVMFAVHPVHVEGVASLVGRADALSALLFIMSATCALLARGHTFAAPWMGRDRDGAVGMATQWTLSFLSLLLAVGAALSKETGFTAFGVLVLIEFLYERPPLSTSEDAAYLSLRGGLVHAYRRCICVLGGSLCAGLRLCGGGALAAKIDQILAHGLFLGTTPKKARQLRFCRVSAWDLAGPVLRHNIASIVRASLSVLCLFGLLLIRYFLHGASTELYPWTVMENHISIIPDTQTRVLSYAQTHWWYVFKLVYPRHLCFDYGYHCMPTVDSILDYRNLLPVLAYAFGVSVFLRGLQLIIHDLGNVFSTSSADDLDNIRCDSLASGSGKRDNRLDATPEGTRRGFGLVMCVILTALPLLPALNILFPVGALLAERLLFMPSVGFCIGAADLLVEDLAPIWAHLNGHLLWVREKVTRQSRIPSAPYILVNIRDEELEIRRDSNVPASLLFFLIPLVLWHSTVVLSRSRDWLGEYDLFKAGLNTCPDSLKALNNYGMLSMSIGNYEDALEAYQRATYLYPPAPSFYVNSGLAYQKSGRFVKSALMFERAVKEISGKAHDSKAHGYYGSMLHEWADSDSLRLELTSAFADSAAGINAVKHMRDRAEGHLDESIKRGFHPPSLLNSRASLALLKEDHFTALHYLRAAVDENLRLLDIQRETPGVPVNDVASQANLYNQLGVALASSGKTEEAILAFKEGLSFQDGARVELVVNLSTLYRRMGGIREAFGVLNDCLSSIYSRGGADGSAVAGTVPIAPQDLPLAAAALNNLGLVQTDMNQFAEAQESFQRAKRCLELLTGGRPEMHPFYRSVTENLKGSGFE